MSDNEIKRLEIYAEHLSNELTTIKSELEHAEMAAQAEANMVNELQFKLHATEAREQALVAVIRNAVKTINQTRAFELEDLVDYLNTTITANEAARGRAICEEHNCPENLCIDKPHMD